MALAQEGIDFIEPLLGQWLAAHSSGQPTAVYEIELRERMDERLAAMRADMDQRFEQWAGFTVCSKRPCR
jgi:hypothetical protein